MGYYKYVRAAWKKPDIKLLRQRYVEWRSQPRFLRIDRPTRIDRARALGYKAKDGFIVVRACIRKGGMTRHRPHSGRKPTNMYKFGKPKKNAQLILEERVQRKYVNMEVLNSYWVGDDGKNKWVEVILVDPNHPQIIADKDINWICEKQHTHRVNRGLTSAGKKMRGLRYRGEGAEKVRPSITANQGRGK